MCEPTPARQVSKFRDPALRTQAAALRAEKMELKAIGVRLCVSTATVQRLLAPVPPLVVDPPRTKVCRHCRTGTVDRPRGLCWSCYYTPGVRQVYTSGSKYARRGVPTRKGNRPLPTPTTAPAGSVQKLLVLIERAERGLRLWHPAEHQAERPAARVETPVRRVAFDR